MPALRNRANIKPPARLKLSAYPTMKRTIVKKPKKKPASKGGKKPAPAKQTNKTKQPKAKKPTPKKKVAPKPANNKLSVKKSATKASKSSTSAKGKKSKSVGLAGKSAAGAVAGTVDSGVPPTHRSYALRLDARLALVDPSVNSDKYYVLQLLEGGGAHWVWTRWGRTGHSGQGKMEGPLSLPDATKLFNKTFKDKTKVPYEQAMSGKASPAAGHYAWLDTAGEAGQPRGRWEYYVDDHVDGKATGWYPYSAEGSTTTEELYRTYVLSGNTGMGVRFVHSGHFTYRVDLTDPGGNFTQQNVDVPPNKTRRIRRVID